MSTPNDLTKSPITHTPGPWRAKVDLFRPPKLFVHAPDSFAVCRVMTAHYHAGTARANAHLLAAAPEMKDALLALMDASIETQGEDAITVDLIAYGRAMQAARAALAKAEGKL